MDHTKLQLLKALTLAEAIRDLETIPNGHLYAHVCGHLSFNEYQQLINVLVAGKLIDITSNVITWIGPIQSTETKVK